MTDPTQETDAAPVPAPAPIASSAEPAEPAERAERSRSRRGRRKPRTGESAAAAAATPKPAGAQPPRSSPALDKLAELYPRHFGAEFLPLKRGVYEELVAAHPDAFEVEALKEALSQHTRSTRYLTAVAAGLPRHDLQGNVSEPMAPEHVHHALLEVFRRRSRRAPNEDLRPKLRNRIAQAYEASGLSPTAYAALVRSARDEAANQLLDEALQDATERHAKGEALLRAFEASGQSSVEAFADMYGMDPRETARTLDRARKLKDAAQP